MLFCTYRNSTQNHWTFFIALWAISKIGVMSLVNTNLQEEALLHCMTIAEARVLLFDSIYESQIATISNAACDAGISPCAYGEP